MRVLLKPCLGDGAALGAGKAHAVRVAREGAVDRPPRTAAQLTLG